MKLVHIATIFISGLSIGISVATMVLSSKHRKTIELYDSVISSQPKYKPVKAIYFNQNTQRLTIITDSGSHRSIRQIGPEDIFYKASK